MKICPRCQKTYTDDNLNFCLDDGVVLQQAGSNEPPATVFMNQPPPTDPRVGMHAPPTMQQQQPAWNTAPQQYGGAQPKKKSSKAWIWVLLILGVVVIGCGTLSVVGLYFIGKSAENQAANTTVTTNSKTTANTRTTANTSASNTTPTFPSNTSTTSGSDGRTDVTDIELSGWVRDTSLYGNTEYTNGEFIMSSKEKGYYYVLVAPDDNTDDSADIRVTLRNINNMDSRYGYGLIFHSNPTPLTQDYAFLINTKTKKFRVVRHEPSDEKTIVAWTASTAIKDGTQENTLEARDKPSDGKVELYINGQLATTIPNTYGYKGGVPGLYAGDAAKVAFKNLQLVK